MKVSNRFRIDLFYYQLGVIIPGISNFATILVLKRFLTPQQFGFFSLRFALVFLLSTISVGWLSQSIVRLLAAENEKRIVLLKSITVIALVILLVTGSLSSFVFVVFFKDQFIWGILMVVALVSNGLYTIMLSYSQAVFKPISVLKGEFVRTIAYFLLSFLVVYFFPMSAITGLWKAVILSSWLGILLLIYENKLRMIDVVRLNISSFFKGYLKQLIAYGGPLSVWFLIWHCMHYIEKPVLMALNSNYEVVGNYQAMFDILSRGASLLLLPVSHAIFPHLTQAFEQKDSGRAKMLLRKVIFAEIILLMGALLLYGTFGFKVLANWFNIPGSNDYYLSGFIILANAIIWQMSVIIHKPLELGKFTSTMLGGMLFAFIVYICCLSTLPTMLNLYLPSYALPALIAGLAYISYISFKIKRLNIW
jgi:O-antigen/teichoic acid export membrane protein